MQPVDFFTLWIVPTGETLVSLQVVINQLAQKYSTNSFEPHVTLLGGFRGVEDEVIEKTQRLGKLLRPYPITLVETGLSEAFFRSVFIRCELTDEIAAANALARTVFDQANDPPYIPHLSLLYGNGTVEEKQRMISEICLQLPLHFKASSMHLFRTPNDDPRPKEKICEVPFSA